AINLPPAFLTPSNQEYHTSNCLMFKKHTNLRIATQNLILWGIDDLQNLLRIPTPTTPVSIGGNAFSFILKKFIRKP
ncbi:hypothetical protein QMM44_13930, partial [Leptospira santarosai]|nr:hypothetical protein [Leptospira santarosai]